MSSAHPGSRANYRVENVGPATVVRVFDDIDIANAGGLGDALFAELGRDRPLVVDIGGLNYIDSIGLHVILRVFQRAGVVRVDAVLVAAGPSLRLVEQVGLNRIVTVVTDVDAALQALRIKSRPAAGRR
ncbi:MAG TPA: STAS domain-containing protein [bacterium]|nr:STAS domain-containing protein [bacterium]